MDIKKYIGELVEKSIYPTMRNLFSNSTENIVRAIREKEYETVDPDSISDPIVDKLDSVEEAIGKIKVEEVSVKNIQEAKTDLTGLIEVFKSEIGKLDKPVEVKAGDVKVDVDTKGIIRAIEKLEISIPKMEQKEVVDYTLMHSQIMEILEKPVYDKSIEEVKKVLNKIATTDDISVLADWMKVVAEKEPPKIPELKFDEYGNLLVTPTKVGGGGGGLTAIEVGYLKNISDNSAGGVTNAKLDTIILRLNEIITLMGGTVDAGIGTMKIGTDFTIA